MTKAKWILAALTVFAATLYTNAQEYWRVITPDHVKRMNQFERVQYTKAINLMNERNYKAASTEFERFRIQYRDSNVVPYIVFLQAYALHQGKDRNKAISVYNEVIDFFGAEINAAAPAMFYRGVAQFDNGDYNKGMLSMKELLDDEDYSLHPVAASANLRMAENYWRNKEPDKAAECLKTLFSKFRKTSPQAAGDAANLYAAYCLSTNRTNEYKKWYVDMYGPEAEEKKVSKEQFRVNMANHVRWVVFDNWHWMYNHDDRLGKYRGGKKSGSDPGQEAWQVFSENKANFEKCNLLWDYYMQSIRVNAGRNYLKPQEFDQLVADTIRFIDSVPDDDKNKGRQQNRYAEIIRSLIQFGRWSQAQNVNQKLTSELSRFWNEYEIQSKQEKWPESLAVLDRIEEKFKTNAEAVKRAGYSRAGIYMDKQRKFDDAIKILRQIADPPRTLWMITDCHKRKGDSKNAIAQLIEIESAFAGDAPRAAMERANYYAGLGERDMSIKEARRIMKVYPKSPQASQSHQLLERFGVDSGGGVLDDM